MKTARVRAALAAIASVALGMMMATNSSAQVWTEIGDAPEGPLSFQVTDGVGPLSAIDGTLNPGGGDHVDTYSIRVTDPNTFYATTASSLGGSTGTLDTRLFLWSVDGDLLLANHDHAGQFDFSSTISDPSTFTALTGGQVDATAQGISLVAGETYLLSITYYPNVPVDANTVDLVSFGMAVPPQSERLFGPNPNAGPFSHWTDPFPLQGKFKYRIKLNGATFAIPEPGSALIAMVGVVGLLGRLRWRGRRGSSS